MSVNIVELLSPEQQFLDSNGSPLAYGWVYVYVNSSSTLTTIYSTQTGTAYPTTGTAQLDAQGRAFIFVPSGLTYTLVVTDVWGVVQAHSDEFTPKFNATTVSVNNGALAPASIVTGSANKVAGTDSSAVFNTNTVSTNLSLTANTLTYTGSALTAGSPILLTTSGSGVSSLDLSAAFSSSYDIYLIDIWDFVSSGATYLGLRLIASGSDLTGANYQNCQFGRVAGTSSDTSGATTKSSSLSRSAPTLDTKWNLTYNSTSDAIYGTKITVKSSTAQGRHFGKFKLMVPSGYYPQLHGKMSYQDNSTSAPVYTKTWGYYNSTSSGTSGFKLVSDSTFSCQVSVTGLKNS